MRQMVLDEQNSIVGQLESVAYQRLDPEFVEQPVGDRLAEQASRAWNGRERCEKDSFELDQRLLEEHDVIEIAGADACLLQAEINRLCGKAVIVLDTAEPLLLGGRNEASFSQQGCSGIVKVAGDSKDVHRLRTVGAPNPDPGALAAAPASLPRSCGRADP